MDNLGDNMVRQSVLNSQKKWRENTGYKRHQTDELRKYQREHAKKLKYKRCTLEIDEQYAKPWKDPESLFCSPRLKEFINKEPMECKQ